MTSIDLNTYVAFGYLAAAFLYLVAHVVGSQQIAIRKLVLGLLLLVLAAHTGPIALRWIESYRQGMGLPPLSNLYELLVFFASTAFLYLVTHVVVGSRQIAIRKIALGVLLVVLAVHTGAIALRWIESYQMEMGHAPLSNLYESLVFFAWSVAVALAVARFRYGTDIIVLLGLPLVFLIMASTFLTDSRIKPLIPALQSNWLVAHVIACFLGYAGFAVSFVAAVLLLMTRGSESLQQHLPRADLLDEIVYRSVLIGLPMLTVGIITGAAWADYAWGSYWSWDPKETWSLITWLVYSAFLHARIARGWSGNRTALLSVVGFAAVLFTYFGVNYLPGLHSYL